MRNNKWLLEGSLKENLFLLEESLSNSVNPEQILYDNVSPKMLKEEGYSILMTAGDYGFWRIVNVLIEQDFNVNFINDAGETLLYFAVKQGDEETTKSLIEKGSSVTGTYDGIPLIAAIADDNEEIVKLLIKNGADVNASEYDGYTPLELSLRNGNYNITQLLIESGADIEIKDSEGNSCLHVAVKYGSLETVKLLLDRVMDVNAVNKLDETPLHLIVRKGDIKMLKLLIANKAYVNLSNFAGETPLHYALILGNNDVAALLLLEGAKYTTPPYEDSWLLWNTGW